MTTTATEVRERPILMSGAMVRACLRDVDPKTQTRRVLKYQPSDAEVAREYGKIRVFALEAGFCGVPCPYVTPLRLWVRESWAPVRFGYDFETGVCDEVGETTPEDARQIMRDADSRPRGGIVYAATDGGNDLSAEERGYRYRPSIHMPRWASRLTLDVLAVRVERLQDITEEDAKAEGAPCEFAPGWYIDAFGALMGRQYRYGFAALWESINGRESWMANPWVWVIGFKRSGT